MNVEIGTEAAQFLEKEYIIGIFLAMYCSSMYRWLDTNKIYFSLLKVHKHEIFFLLFLQKPKPYGPKGLLHEILKIVFDTAEIFDF